MKNNSLIILFIALLPAVLSGQSIPELSYRVDLGGAKDHVFHMELTASGLDQDTVLLSMPVWTPGYYGLMGFPESISNIAAFNGKGESINIEKAETDTWRIITGGTESITLEYDITASRKFVAQSFIDSSHAYIVPGNNFMYIEDRLELPVTIEIEPGELFSNRGTASGLEKDEDNPYIFTAPDFDKLYDSPVLISEMEELPSFEVNGVKHYFRGYKLGVFNHELFIEELQKIVECAVSLMGDIPYDEYTFIGIGPGRGGIEHLNNTTVSFDGSRLTDRRSMLGTLSFLAHEYFHHFNVKRIRPFELGPFDYSRPNRTNQLWVSEGLTVYYQHVLTRMSGLAGEKDFISSFERLINSLQTNDGRFHQSLAQASYYTWEAGPFGQRGKTISYYEKGALVGMAVDLAIRQATNNERSLDDVMRYVYYRYYKELDRGFTDAEFQQACELMAGTSLSDEFEYVYTTREMDYNRYLNYAGLELVEAINEEGQVKYSINELEQPDPLQNKILDSWLRNQPKEHSEKQ